MKAILLNGAAADDIYGEQVTRALTAQLHSRGWEVETFILRDLNIGNCAGDFFCWVRSPGICNTNDDNRLVAEAIAKGDLLVYLTPVTFGGYSSTLKRMVDHQIQNISPFFEKVEEETHHQKRYSAYADFLCVGWMDQPNAKAEEIFKHLASRNAINFHAKRSHCAILNTSVSEKALREETSNWLKELQTSTSSTAPLLTAQSFELENSGFEVQNAVLLVGSPRLSKSTSHSLGSYLMDQLAARGVETEIFQVYTSLNSPDKMRNLLEKLAATDLVVLAFPLYVDSLPGAVMQLLERIADYRTSHMTDRSLKTRFAALANCGFPEASHNATALAICAEFSRTAGFDWAGGIMLGAGEGLVHGVPLTELGGRAFAVTNALNLAAGALAVGDPIPQEAQDLLSKPFIPAWIYRLAGGLGWKQQAKQYGVEKMLRRKPYLN